MNSHGCEALMYNTSTETLKIRLKLYFALKELFDQYIETAVALPREEGCTR